MSSGWRIEHDEDVPLTNKYCLPLSIAWGCSEATISGLYFTIVEGVMSQLMEAITILPYLYPWFHNRWPHPQVKGIRCRLDIRCRTGKFSSCSSKSLRNLHDFWASWSHDTCGVYSIISPFLDVFLNTIPKKTGCFWCVFKGHHIHHALLLVESTQWNFLKHHFLPDAGKTPGRLGAQIRFFFGAEGPKVWLFEKYLGMGQNPGT